MRQVLGLYIHIPFCKQKCKYCDFYSVTADPNTIRRYADAVIRYMNRVCDRFQECVFDTLFIGGGTPSVMGDELVRIISHTRKVFNFTSEAEMTCEANPDSLNYDLIVKLKNAGINRISIGGQSFCDSELVDLGRIHNAESIVRAYNDCLRAGISNINIDIMFNIGHRVSTENHLSAFSHTLDRILRLNPTHISCYNLTLQEKTDLYNHADEYVFASGQEEDEMYQILCSTFAAHGYEHYEISNFAKPGYECKHNIKYWKSQPYLGIGPAAHSYVDGIRYSCESDLAAFLEGDERVIIEERMSDASLANERLITGLRLKSGVGYEELEPYFDLFNMKKLLIELEKHKLITSSSDGFALTEKGFRISNSIICRLTDYFKG